MRWYSSSSRCERALATKALNAKDAKDAKENQQHYQSGTWVVSRSAVVGNALSPSGSG